MRKYYLNIPLPDSLEKQVESIRKKFHYKPNSRPHIALLSPREAGEWTKDEIGLIDCFSKALSNEKPFAVKYGDINYFGEYSTIYVSVVRSDALVRIHELVKGASEEYLMPDEGPFGDMPSPHISLFSCLPVELGEKRYKELEDTKLSGEFICDRINIMRRPDGGDGWQIARTLVI